MINTSDPSSQTHRIQGMQHIGVAVTNMDRSVNWYRQLFGMDVPFFDSVQEAPLMDSHTRGETILKRASMVINLQGGCAFEVLQPASFDPKPASWEIAAGDLGLTTVQMKTKDIHKMHAHARLLAGEHCDETLSLTPWGAATFFMGDLDGNAFQILEADDSFARTAHPSGGVLGCTIGVSDMETSMNLYANHLGYNEVIFDETGIQSDWKHRPHGSEHYRRVRLTQSNSGAGGFGPITGRTYIELVQAKDRTGRFVFEDRIWCDTGFAHLGFDVRGMDSLGKALAEHGFGFRCDTADAIGMGETKVHCTYIDDPDECWLEMIEVYKIPIIEKWGLFLDVQKRGADESLPRWMLHALRFSRVRD
jgi:catechol 2,3-dioxygenase-like lactoylglutathione lyase family enzyme